MIILSIKNYCVRIANQTIIDDVSLTLEKGTIHVLMGPNGSGKSSLLKSLLKDQELEVVGQAFWNNQLLTDMTTYQRALSGMFLILQHPIAIDGLKVSHFLYEMMRLYNKEQIHKETFELQIKEALHMVHLPYSIVDRCVHVGFSGGEKKRFELMQIFLIKPTLILLDEIDSGVDIDGLKVIAQALTAYKTLYPDTIILVVSHYGHLFEYMHVDQVHILLKGRFVQTADRALINQIMQYGYESYAKRFE